MSSGLKFKVGEQVLYPQLVCNEEGKHAVQNRTWKIKTIFPVSRVAILLETGCRKPTQVQVSLEKLLTFNG